MTSGQFRRPGVHQGASASCVLRCVPASAVFLLRVRLADLAKMADLAHFARSLSQGRSCATLPAGSRTRELNTPNGRSVSGVRTALHDTASQLKTRFGDEFMKLTSFLHGRSVVTPNTNNSQVKNIHITVSFYSFRRNP